MAKSALKTIKVRDNDGPVIVELEALNAHPMSGFMQTVNDERVEPISGGGGSVVRWELPARDEIYVFVGVVLPQSKLRRAPKYFSEIRQGTKTLANGKRRKIKTKKVTRVEWRGIGQAIRIDAR